MQGFQRGVNGVTLADELVQPKGGNGEPGFGVLDAVASKQGVLQRLLAARYQEEINLKRALREVIGYRLYRDLKRGWRVTSPNLEQCGLLEIRYPVLEELCNNDADWDELLLPGDEKRKVHRALFTATLWASLKTSSDH